MAEQKIAISSAKVGIIALTCLAAWVLIYVFFGNDKDWTVWRAAFMRVGLVMAAFWLALPSRYRAAAWADVSPLTFVGLLCGIVAVGRYPRRLIPVAIAVLVAWIFLRPRKKARPGTRTH